MEQPACGNHRLIFRANGDHLFNSGLMQFFSYQMVIGGLAIKQDLAELDKKIEVVCTGLNRILLTPARAANHHGNVEISRSR